MPRTRLEQLQKDIKEMKETDWGEYPYPQRAKLSHVAETLYDIVKYLEEIDYLKQIKIDRTTGC